MKRLRVTIDHGGTVSILKKIEVKITYKNKATKTVTLTYSNFNFSRFLTNSHNKRVLSSQFLITEKAFSLVSSTVSFSLEPSTRWDLWFCCKTSLQTNSQYQNCRKWDGWVPNISKNQDLNEKVEENYELPKLA